MKTFFKRLSSFFTTVLMAAAVLVSLCGPSVARSGFTGMQIQGMSPKIAQALGRKTIDGILVRDVALGGPADSAGIKRGDLILKYAGKKIDSFKTMVLAAGSTKSGQQVKVSLIREGKPVDLTMTLGEWTEPWKITQTAVAAIAPLGLTMATLTQKMRKGLDLRWSSTGVVVTLVDQEKKFMELVRGDLIIQVNQEEVWLPEQVLAKYTAAKKAKRKNLLLLVERANGFQYMSLPVK
ncbi:MAG: PDZ domain-containing protein [Rhodospirillales bacterium]|nr:PDZ domain-containing protein [Rhodospirillales bacterium]